MDSHTPPNTGNALMDIFIGTVNDTKKNIVTMESHTTSIGVMVLKNGCVMNDPRPLVQRLRHLIMFTLQRTFNMTVNMSGKLT